MSGPRWMLQAGRAAAPTDLIKDTTTQTFMKDVIEESQAQPVLVDFWARGAARASSSRPSSKRSCAPPRARSSLPRWISTSTRPFPGQMGIQSIPAVIAFVNGQPADGFMGALPESQVVGLLERLTKEQLGARGAGPAQDCRGRAGARATPAGAAELYAQVLAAEPTNVAALAGLARCYVDTGAIEQAKQTLAHGAGSKRNDAAVAAAQAAIDLAEQANSVGPLGELEQKVAANPARPSGAIRSCRRAQRRAGRKEARRPPDRHHQARPQME